jgi:hypothetical protein
MHVIYVDLRYNIIYIIIYVYVYIYILWKYNRKAPQRLISPRAQLTSKLRQIEDE